MSFRLARRARRPRRIRRPAPATGVCLARRRPLGVRPALSARRTAWSGLASSALGAAAALCAFATLLRPDAN
ncbi:MAG: hypothetical protein R3F11_27350 [Verrucomicrobiales bacterium]